MLPNTNPYKTSQDNLLKERHVDPSSNHGNMIGYITACMNTITDFSNLNLDILILDNSSIVVTNLEGFAFKVERVL